MTEKHNSAMLMPCPCGQTPTGLTVAEDYQRSKWAYVSPNCCGEWEIEFRNQYTEGEEQMKLAIDAWNAAPRSWLKNNDQS